MNWKRVLNWPSNPENIYNNYAPWWVIAWRFPWMCLVILGKAISFIGVLMGSLSLDEAVFYWHNS